MSCQSGHLSYKSHGSHNHHRLSSVKPLEFFFPYLSLSVVWSLCVVYHHTGPCLPILYSFKIVSALMDNFNERLISDSIIHYGHMSLAGNKKESRRWDDCNFLGRTKDSQAGNPDDWLLERFPAPGSLQSKYSVTHPLSLSLFRSLFTE